MWGSFSDWPLVVHTLQSASSTQADDRGQVASMAPLTWTREVQTQGINLLQPAIREGTRRTEELRT